MDLPSVSACLDSMWYFDIYPGVFNAWNTNFTHKYAETDEFVSSLWRVGRHTAAAVYAVKEKEAWGAIFESTQTL